MGEKLKRQWISFEKPILPDNLADMKIENNSFIRSDKFTTIEIYINLLKEFDYSKPYYPSLLSEINNIIQKTNLEI